MLYMAINFGDWVLTGQPSRSSCLSEPLAIATAGSAKRHTYIPISHLSSCACLLVASVDPLAVFDLEGGEPRLRPLDQIPEEVRRCISSIKETADGFRVAFHSLHPALDRLSRYYNTLSELDDRNAVTVDDQEKAKVVADWIERMALEQKVTTCAELVELLRKRST